MLRREVLPRLHELLQAVCAELCGNRGPPHIIDKEGHGMVVGALLMVCLLAIERNLVCCANFAVSRP